MNRALRVRALLALAVLGLSLFVALTTPIRLGLDLRGGTQIVLETRPPDGRADREAADRTLEVLRGRVDALGVAEPVLARSGENRIVVELPGVQDPADAAEVLGRTAQLTFHPVLGTAGPEEEAESEERSGSRKEAESDEKREKASGSGAKTGAEAKAGAEAPPGAEARTDSGTRKPESEAKPQGGAESRSGERVLPDESGVRLRLGPAALTGKDVEEAAARFDAQTGAGWHVTVDFKGSGGAAWARLTGDAACHAPGDPARRVAVVLDDTVISSPQVDPSVSCGSGITGGATQITGSFDAEEAKELALLVNGGALPVPVEIVEQRTVGPTLGQEAVRASALAAVIGAVLTAVFVIAVYRIAGLLATVALACYGLISYAALALLGATLTLPGLAGFVLAVGMAVDANVLVFERAREEYAARVRPSPRSAMTAGFRGALGAVADSNITTLIAAGLLFLLASGPVRGFGVTLAVGVLASMVSALVITRVLVDLAVARGPVHRRPRLTGIAHPGALRTRLGRAGDRFLRRPWRWAAAGALVAVLAGSGIAVRGLDLGVEFTGGRVVEYATSAPADAERVRGALADAGFTRAVVQTSGDERLTVRTGELTEPEAKRLTETVDEAVEGGAERVRDEAIGPSLGAELRRGALIAVLVALGAQLLYLAVRFRWFFGVAAVSALALDVLVLTGVFAWLEKPVDGVFLAALLTVIGYSVNDSVVLFDRVRELVRRKRGASFADLVGRAVLQTLPRTVNTGIGAALVLTALAVLGDGSLTDFALALLVGIAVGTCSTVVTAAPLAVVLERRK